MPRHLLPGAFSFLCLLAGCGLSDYEKRMDESLERLRAIEQEAALLGDLIQTPFVFTASKEAKSSLPFDIHLRLPKGIPGKYAPENSFQFDSQALHGYMGKKDVNVFIAAAMLLDKDAKQPAKDAKDPGVTPEKFRFRVRGGLQTYFLAKHNHSPTFPEAVAPRKEKKQALRNGQVRNLAFELYEYEDGRLKEPSHLFLFYHQWSDRQAAIVFQVPKQQAASADFLKAMDISLKSLEISPLAKQLRKQAAG